MAQLRNQRSATADGQINTTTALWKPWGLRNVSANSPLADTRGLKFNVDAPFDAVQIEHYHFGTTTPTWKFAVAVTETADTSTNANIGKCIVGGTAYDVIDSTSDAYGLRTATFAGASSKTLAGTGSLTTDAVTPEIITSDWIPLSAVPRADGGDGYLLQVYGIPTTAATQSASWINPTGAAAMRTVSAANRKRIIQTWRATGTDVIASPGTGTYSLVVDSIPVGVKFRFRSKAASVMAIGDSTVQNQAIVADNYTSWLWRACADISTADFPVTPINMGASSSKSLEYHREGLRMLALHRPTVATYQCYSPNDTPVNSDGAMRYLLQRMSAQIMEFLDYCRQYGVRPILDTGLPYASALTTASWDNLRKAHAVKVRALAAASGAVLLDSEAYFGNGGTPADIRYPFNLDKIHYNEAGIEDKAVYLAVPAIRSALGL